ncbi:MAG: hypothetical protein FRX48_06850 [Lasallia pustulata]|uniref:Azaphilone pigments biosynthesis cluster protein L N-terminal domain-containing protein n=1 Tax=Lasallia pustulata TaxID=136370 RepID=A0A5M8PIY0_9LECA|nr:MAG: hypothetical protein FRX48_06850 [Lasallia pustulata]
MDPLSLTVSVVALMTTAVQTVRGLEKLRRAFGAQEKLLELFNEVADLRALFFVVHEIVIRNDTEEAPIKAISQVLDRAYVLLEDLNSLIHQILKPTGPQETSRLSRRAWLLQEGRLLQLRDSLRDLRNRLNIGISAFTSSEIPQIRLHLNDLSISTSAMAAQQSDIYDQINHQATILQEFLDQRVSPSNAKIGRGGYLKPAP